MYSDLSQEVILKAGKQALETRQWAGGYGDVPRHPALALRIRATDCHPECKSHGGGSVWVCKGELRRVSEGPQN